MCLGGSFECDVSEGSRNERPEVFLMSGSVVGEGRAQGTNNQAGALLCKKTKGIYIYTYEGDEEELVGLVLHTSFYT